jgi:hypothetical protein
MSQHPPDRFAPFVAAVRCLDPNALDAWLGRALRDQERLPRLEATEAPHVALHRLEQRLVDVTRTAFRESCTRLVQRYLRHPAEVEHADLYVTELLRLSTALKLEAVRRDWLDVITSVDTVTRLPGQQPERVLEALIDQGISPSLVFWQQLGKHDPRRFGVQAFSGLLGHGPKPAVALLPLLPDEEVFGDALHAVLAHHAEHATSQGNRALAQALQGVVGELGAELAAAAAEWLAEHPTPQSGPQAPDWNGLELALEAAGRRHGQPYPREPQSARLAGAP